MPSRLRAAFEFRHVSWFDGDVFSVLRDHNAALCIAESEKLIAPVVATADFGYLRLRREDYVHADIEHWAEFVHGQEQHWREVFIYFKHEERGIGPKFAQQMMELLRAVPVGR
jgi:uncharacterized protein YecE (DUF72 family)